MIDGLQTLSIGALALSGIFLVRAVNRLRHAVDSLIRDRSNK